MNLILSNTPYFLLNARSSSIRFVLLVCFVSLLYTKGYAQTPAVYAINDPQGTDKVLLKWYSPDFVYDEGVNIYRKSSGSLTWEKLTASPLMRGNEYSQRAQQGDSALWFMESLILDDSTSTFSDLKQTFFYVNVLFMSIQDREYAEFLGIYYEDQTATVGQTYEYRVSKISSGREIPLGISKPILVGDYKPDQSVKEIDIYQEKQKVAFDWKVEEDRFYAVNVYVKKGSAVNEFYKLNDHPIVISEVEDSLGNYDYPTPKFLLDSVNIDEVYGFKVRGLGFFNEEFNPTEEVNFKIEDNIPPKPPIGLVSDYDSLTVNLQWVNPDDEDFEGVWIYKSSKSDGTYERINDALIPADQTKYVEQALVAGNYYYKVASVDQAGNESLSDYAYAKVPDVFPPAKPTGLLIKSDTGRMHLTWHANAESDLWGYLVYRTTASNEEKDYRIIHLSFID